MPELNLGPPPSRSPLPAVAIAVVVLVAIAAAVFYFNPHKTAELAVTRVQLHSEHTELKAQRGTSNIIGAPPSIENDLYVLVSVKLDNKLRLPLFLKDETAVLTAPDHSVAEVSALRPAELENLYLSFPDIKPKVSPLLPRDTQVAPGQSAEGMVVLHFPGATEKDWAAREKATLTLQFFHQDPQVVTIPK